jgi:hypothetical protein
LIADGWLEQVCMPLHPLRKIERQAIFEHCATLAHARPTCDVGRQFNALTLKRLNVTMSSRN